METRRGNTWKGIAIRSGLVAVIAVGLAAQMALAQSSIDIKNEIDAIAKDVSQKKNELIELNRKADQYQKVILQKKLESASIEDQIGFVEAQIGRAQLNIDVATDEIKSLELQVKEFDARIREQQAVAEREKALLAGLVRTLFREGYGRDPLEILLSKRTFSDFFVEAQRLIELQGGVKEQLAKVKALSADLAVQKQEREKAQLAAEERKRDLEAQRAELEDQRGLKATILADTRSSEMQYRSLLASLRREQTQADSEISYLEKVLREKTELANRLSNQSAALMWPVVPARGLSTMFHDPEYPFRHVFEHPGIDIRAEQGTPVRAAASGVVARAKNAGMGYSYIMILHNGNISTVYGHISRIIAREDAFVQRGEIIGYSGGAPGTPGAGNLTTGPHLHFETRKNGIPVDPMVYLTAM